MYYLKIVGLVNFLNMRSKLSTLPPVISEGEDCGVCMSEVYEGRVLSCKHVFHADCLM